MPRISLPRTKTVTPNLASQASRVLSSLTLHLNGVAAEETGGRDDGGEEAEGIPRSELKQVDMKTQLQHQTIERNNFVCTKNLIFPG
jgi:hypothetical protein